MSVESSDVLMEEIGAQTLTTAAYQLPHTVLQTTDAVTQEDVVKVCGFGFRALSALPMCAITSLVFKTKS